MSDFTIKVGRDGPYAVSAGVPLAKGTIGANGEGDSTAWVPGEAIPVERAYFLCRCGQSANKPFCDGSHARAGFDGAETAGHAAYADVAREIDGPITALTDAEALCAFARFCDRDGQVWNTVAGAGTDQAQAAFAAQVGQCPSGRLVAWDRRTGQALEPDLPPSIMLVEDPQQGVSGPIWVRGGVTVIDAEGVAYEVRNRLTLCRCGASSNKPFCDGSHASIGFKDA